MYRTVRNNLKGHAQGQNFFSAAISALVFLSSPAPSFPTQYLHTT
jgi:hypothetical protein